MCLLCPLARHSVAASTVVQGGSTSVHARSRLSIVEDNAL